MTPRHSSLQLSLFAHLPPGGLSMAPRYLLDGYNLIHAIGLLPSRVVNGRTLQASRDRLIEFLHASFDGDCKRIEIVFDAHTSAKRVPPFHSALGVSVRFAKVADDCIYDLVHQDATPASLHVVSNDHAVRDAAKRRGAVAMSCDAFLDEAERHKKNRPGPQPTADTKPEPTAGELDYWLRKFGNLDP